MKRVVLSTLFITTILSAGIASAEETAKAGSLTTDPYCNFTPKEAKEVAHIQTVINGSAAPLLGMSGGKTCLPQEFLLKNPKDAAFVSHWLQKHWQGTYDVEFHAIPPAPTNVAMNG